MSINEDKKEKDLVNEEKMSDEYIKKDMNPEKLNEKSDNFHSEDILTDVNSIFDNFMNEKNIENSQSISYAINHTKDTSEIGELKEINLLKSTYESKIEDLEKKIENYLERNKQLEIFNQKHEKQKTELTRKSEEFDSLVKDIEKRNQELIDSKMEYDKRNEQLQEGREHFLTLSQQLETKKNDLTEIEKKLLKDQRLIERNKFEIEKNRIDLEKEKLEFEIGKSEIIKNISETGIEVSSGTFENKEGIVKEEKKLKGKAEVLESLLKNLCDSGNFKSCFLIDGKGMIVSEYSPGSLDTMAIGAMFSLIYTTALRTVNSLSLQKLEHFKLSSLSGDFLAKDINIDNYGRNFILLTYNDGKTQVTKMTKNKMSKRSLNKIFKNIKEDFYIFGQESKLPWVFDNYSEKLNLLKQKYTLANSDFEIERSQLLNKTSIEIKELFES